MENLQNYLKNRPPHLALIRSSEIPYYNNYQPFKYPLLDFGCGDGYFLKSLVSRKKGQITGADIKPSTINTEKQSIYDRYINLNFDPLPRNKFQTIITNCVFEHIEKLENSLNKIFNSLKPNGILLTTVATNNFPDYLFLKFIPGYKNFFNSLSNHQNLLSPPQWVEKFNQTGFKVIEKQPYLQNKKLMRLFDLSHWLGIPYLISYKLFNNWNPRFFSFYNKLWYKQIMKLRRYQNQKEAPPYMFYALQK